MLDGMAFYKTGEVELLRAIAAVAAAERDAYRRLSKSPTAGSEWSFAVEKPDALLDSYRKTDFGVSGSQSGLFGGAECATQRI